MFVNQIFEAQETKNILALKASTAFFAALEFPILVLELFNLYKEMYKKKSFVFIHTASVVSTWIEDVPQISIALYVAFRLEDRLTWVQYAKAGYAIFEAVARMVGFMVYVYIRDDQDKKKLIVLVAMKTAACVIIIIFSSAIFLKLFNADF